jgi:hypothetical protein
MQARARASVPYSSQRSPALHGRRRCAARTIRRCACWLTSRRCDQAAQPTKSDRAANENAARRRRLHNVPPGSLSAPESASAPCYTEEAEAKQAECARFGDARRAHSRCISSHARLRDTPGPGVGEGPTSRRQIHGDQVVCVRTTLVVVKTPLNFSRQAECRRIEQHAAEIFGQRCANTAKAAILRNRKARNAKKPRRRGGGTQGEVNCARQSHLWTGGLRPVVYELLSWRHARVRLRGQEHHENCRSCDSAASSTNGSRVPNPAPEQIRRGRVCATRSVHRVPLRSDFLWQSRYSRAVAYAKSSGVNLGWTNTSPDAAQRGLAGTRQSRNSPSGCAARSALSSTSMKAGIDLAASGLWCSGAGTTITPCVSRAGLCSARR